MRTHLLPRSENPFIAVNCGAISAELIESEFFGRVKGAFTGASESKQGYVEAAHAGTLFLDEIGDLPLLAQVKLLRVLQEEVTPVGATKPIQCDVRIIAATHKKSDRRSRRAPFSGRLVLPPCRRNPKSSPLRDRDADLALLIDNCLAIIESTDENRKKLSVGARSFLLNHLLRKVTYCLLGAEHGRALLIPTVSVGMHTSRRRNSSCLLSKVVCCFQLLFVPTKFLGSADWERGKFTLST